LSCGEPGRFDPGCFVVASFGIPVASSSPFSRFTRIFFRRDQSPSQEAREPGDLNAVASIRASLHDLPEEDDLPVPFLDRHIEILHPFLGEGELRQLVVMRGKECLGLRRGRS